MMSMGCVWCAWIGLVLAAGPMERADLVLLEGKVATLDAANPEAEAVAILGDRILAVGKREDVRKFIDAQTKVVPLGGRRVVPGFIEGHGHFISFGRSMMNLNLADTGSWEELLKRTSRHVQDRPKGTWIYGRGWHQEKWSDRSRSAAAGYPTHQELSQVTPDHPVLLTHATGHMSLANAKAMELAGITKETEDPPGGEILRDARGIPTGVFRETAQGLFDAAIADDRRRLSPAEREQETLEAVELATKECLRHGVTTFHDASSDFATIDVFRRLASEGRLGVRLWVMIGESNRALAEKGREYRMTGAYDQKLTVRGVKRMIDGALGSHGAWLLAPYDDLPSSSGLVTQSPDYLDETAQICLDQDLQLCVHAIGDRANREVLNLFEAAFRRAGKSKELRWRIEHAQHLSPDDIPRFGRLGVIASMQGVHCTSDAPFVVPRLGVERARSGAYAWRALLDSGAVVTNGTDVPVEAIDPLASFYSSVTRRLRDESEFFPEQKMSRFEALASYTRDGAYAGFEDDQKGVLSAGRLADLVVLSKDVLTVSDAELKDVRVEMTILGGEVVYRAE